MASSHGHMNQATYVCVTCRQNRIDVCNACDVSNIPDALHSQTSGTQPELFALKCNSEVILLVLSGTSIGAIIKDAMMLFKS